MNDVTMMPVYSVQLITNVDTGEISTALTFYDPSTYAVLAEYQFNASEFMNELAEDMAEQAQMIDHAREYGFAETLTAFGKGEPNTVVLTGDDFEALLDWDC